jgi:hypothetical protein
MRSLIGRVRTLAPGLLLLLAACGNQATFSSTAPRQGVRSTDATVALPPTATSASTATATPFDEPELEPQAEESVEPESPEEPAPDEVKDDTPAVPGDVDPGDADPGEVVVLPPMPVTVEQTFAAARLEDFKIVVDPPNRYASQLVTLREAAPAVASLRQIDRGKQEDAYTQGHDGMIADPQQFQLTRVGVLDLLVIVDDSNSMGDEQANLSTKLAALLSSIGNTDWQIRVITTSNPCPRNNRIIRAGDADAAAAFKSAVEVPLIPGVIEKGLPMGIKGLKGECNNVTTPWLRADSAVALLILSDEENCSSPYGDGCPGELGESPQHMIDYLASIRPAGKARFYAIIEGPGNPCGNSAYEAAEYKAVVDATGGAWGSICDADYSRTLSVISANVSRIIDRRFELAQIPDMGTLMLTIDGKPVTSGFRIEGKTLILEPDIVTVDDLQLVVTYRYGATPKFDRVTLSQGADPDTLKVKVGSDMLASDEYTFDSATRELIFDELPADDAVVTVKYRLDQALPRRFALDGVDLLGAPLGVTVGGQPAAYTFDPSGPAVELQTAPADGETVTVRHRTAAGRVTRYPTAFADRMIVPVARDAQTGAAVAVQLDFDEIVVAADEVVDGRRLQVRFDLGDTPQELVYDLGHEPVPGSVSVVDASGNDVCDAQTVGSVVTLSCEPAEAGSFTLSYRHIAERYTAFKLPGQFPPDAATWEVWVDDQRLDDFVRNGHTITIAAGLLAADSKVKVAATYVP